MNESKALAELLDQTRQAGPSGAPDDVAAIFAEWAERYQVDDRCEEDGELPEGYTTALVIYMEAAYQECIDRGLLPAKDRYAC